MGRAPFPGTPAPAPQAPMQPQQPRPGSIVSGRQPAERRTLVVGRGISVQGVVQDAERLVVEGTVESTMIHATELMVAPGGVFRGEVEVEDSEVAGTIDGTVTARGSLIVRATGKVLGTARCRRLQVEDGGQITGRIEMITEPARPSDPARPVEVARPAEPGE
ncbi:bactofilin family protein [Limobrevibacterium gyesilva]|nr:polymer-forming cytoskeletal protein [Limobrevibacterium gyesilva]